MDLNDLVNRQIPPEPWEEGEKTPWHEPEFSQRMLREHLSQEHDAASTQAFDESQYRDLLAEAGFEASEIIPSLMGVEEGDDFYIVLLAQKGNG